MKMIYYLLILGLIIAVRSQTLAPFTNYTKVSMQIHSKLVRFPLGTPMLDLLRHAFSCTRLKCPGPYFVFGHFALDDHTHFEDLKTYHRSSFQEECPGITMYHILYFGACLHPCNTTADCAVVVGDNSADAAGWHCCPVRDIILDDRVELRCIPYTT
uniref:Single domain-containing protein n=1 Tax=Strigamia maritima TaxID=126957 RepID=T1J9E5_STRMM